MGLVHVDLSWWVWCLLALPLGIVAYFSRGAIRSLSSVRFIAMWLAYGRRQRRPNAPVLLYEAHVKRTEQLYRIMMSPLWAYGRILSPAYKLIVFVCLVIFPPLGGLVILGVCLLAWLVADFVFDKPVVRVVPHVLNYLAWLARAFETGNNPHKRGVVESISQAVRELPRDVSSSYKASDFKKLPLVASPDGEEPLMRMVPGA